MTDKPKRETPPDKLPVEQRVRAARQAMFQEMLKDAAKG